MISIKRFHILGILLVPFVLLSACDSAQPTIQKTESHTASSSSSTEFKDGEDGPLNSLEDSLSEQDPLAVNDDETPLQEVTSDGVPIQQANGDDSPAQAAGGDDSPSQAAGGDDSPSQVAGGVDSPSQAAGGGDSPSQVAGGDDSPSQVAGGDDSPSQAAGGDDSPSQAAGVDDSPSQAAGGDDSPSQVAGGDDSPSQAASDDDTPSQVVNDGEVPSQIASLEVVAIEVNQSVQSWDMSVPLITDKLGVLRAFIQTNGEAEIVTSGLLFGTRSDGTDLPMSPLAPVNPAGTVEVKNDVAMRRDDRDSSLNFVLPREWMQTGTTLRLELPGGAICVESAPPANTCSVKISTTLTNDLHYRSVAISYMDGGAVVAPGRADLIEQAQRTLTQFPIADIDVDTGVFAEVLSSAPDIKGDLIGRLNDMRSDECVLGACDEDAYWYGVIAGNAGGGKALGVPGKVSVGYTGNLEGKSEQGYARNRGPYELARLLGRPNAVDGSLGLVKEDLISINGLKQGYCGELADKDDENFPHISAIDGMMVPTLGPLGDPETEIWGFDNRFYNESKQLAVSNPSITLPLMSYGNSEKCSLASQGQFRWISSHNYNALIKTLGAPSAPVASSNNAAGNNWNGLFISGTINFNDESVAFRQARILPSGRVNFNSTGSFSLDIIDVNDNLISTVNFDPVVVDADAPNDGIQRGYFNVPVQLPAEPLGRVDVRFGTKLLGSQLGSSFAPSVNITAPLAGTEINDELVDIAWDGSDADGDLVTYSVFYSPDGISWRGLIHNTESTSITTPKEQLAASNNGKLLVVASDGTNSSRSELPLLIIGNNAPSVSIVSPSENAFFSDAQSIFLDAGVHDREEGELDGSMISWESDLDGSVGDGAERVISASDLSEGTHLLSVSAVDSEGSIATDQTSIVVTRIAQSAKELCIVADVSGIRLSGKDGELEVTSAVPVVLSDGTYEILLESADYGHDDSMQSDQSSEQWFLEGLDSNGSVVFSTALSDDLPVDSQYGSTNVGSYDISGVVEVRGRHAFVTPDYNSIEPIRAIFTTSNCVLPEG